MDMTLISPPPLLSVGVYLFVAIVWRLPTSEKPFEYDLDLSPKRSVVRSLANP